MAELVVPSLLYRLQGSHIILGTTENIRILGTHVTVLYIDDGTDRNVKTDDDKFDSNVLKPEPPSESKIDGDTQFDWKFAFDSSPFTHDVYKIGPSTRIRIQFRKTDLRTKLSGLELDLLQKQEQKQNVTTSTERMRHKLNKYAPILFGLDRISTNLIESLKNFALVTYKADETMPHLEVENGILLYGLPGCGKRSILQSIAERTHAKLADQNWCDHIVFASLTPDVIQGFHKSTPSTKSTLTSEIVSWINKQLDPNTSNTLHSVVLIWPNMDQSFGTQLNSTTPNPDDDHDDQNSSVKFGQFLHSLVEALNLLGQRQDPRPCRFLVLATAESTDAVFNFPDCRKLFYRRLLVSLPDPECRFQILKQQLKLRVKHHWFLKESEQLIDDNSLIKVASKLHGYTPRDLVRLVQLSYGALLSDLTSTIQTEPSSNQPDKSAEFNQKLYDILIRESKSYLPINLSQQITHFEPLCWKDIGGYDKLKTMFQTMIENRLLHAARPDSLEARADANLGLRVPRGILLHGPPGCSKTMFVRALATECCLPLIAVQASRIFGRYVGDSERNMRQILVQARASAPAILFIDEIDLLLPSRSSSETGASEHVLSEVLTAMDGVEGQSGQVILVGATNRMDKLDSALRRAGRFDLVIEVPAPDSNSRADILRMELSRRAVKNKSLLKSTWLLQFSDEYLDGYTGAEVVRLVEQAAQLARDDQSNQIGFEHLKDALRECPASTLVNYSIQFGDYEPSVSESVHVKRSGWSRLFVLYFTAILVLVGAMVSRYYLN